MTLDRSTGFSSTEPILTVRNVTQDFDVKGGLPGWRYPLLRWWETSLARGWMGTVEYFAPPWGRGSLLQGWSSMPAAVALRYRDVVLKGDAEGLTQSVSSRFAKQDRDP